MSSLIDRVKRSLAYDEGCDDPELHDLNYRDALLDVELRTLIRNEYRDVEPPPNSFAKVLHAVNQRQEHIAQGAANKRTSARGPLHISNPQPSTRFGQRLVALYRTFSRPDVARIFSGSLAAALLILVIAPSLLGSLNGRILGVNLSGSRLPENVGVEQERPMSIPSEMIQLVHPEVSDTASSEDQAAAIAQWQLSVETKMGETGEDLTAAYQPLEAPTLHPVELGIANQRNNKQNNQYGRTGPQ